MGYIGKLKREDFADLQEQRRGRWADLGRLLARLELAGWEIRSETGTSTTEGQQAITIVLERR